MYGEKDASLAPKVVILVSECLLIALSYAVLFGDLFASFRAFGKSPSPARNGTLFAFNVVVFARFLFTLFVFLRRKIPWEEAISVPMAFALYLLGFPLLARGAASDFGRLGLVGILLFASGSFINTFSEYQRHRFKARPEGKGKLYTSGLFSLSMHVNYFGDLLWVTGYACVTHNVYASLVPAFLFIFFYAFNIPKLDAYLKQRYPAQFTSYASKTKRFIPFVL